MPIVSKVGRQRGHDALQTVSGMVVGKRNYCVSRGFYQCRHAVTKVIVRLATLSYDRD